MTTGLTMERVAEARAAMSAALLSRTWYCRRTGRGAISRYAIALVQGAEGHLHCVTPRDSLPLTAGLVGRLAEHGLVWIQGAVPAAIEGPPPGTPDGAPVTELRALWVARPHSRVAPGGSHGDTLLLPEHVEAYPWVGTLDRRPDGWPL
jgi:hypothetical protein